MTTRGDIEGDTRGLDYSSYRGFQKLGGILLRVLTKRTIAY